MISCQFTGEEGAVHDLLDSFEEAIRCTITEVKEYNTLIEGEICIKFTIEEVEA